MAGMHEALRGVFAWEREVKDAAARTTSESRGGTAPAAGDAAGGASWWEAQADAGEASVFETAWKDMPPVREPIHVRVTHSEPKKERTVPRRSGGLVSTANTKFAPKGSAAAGTKNLADKIDEAAAAAVHTHKPKQAPHGGGGGGGGAAPVGKEAAKKMKMGAQEYYKAWDKFDADAELQRLEGDAPAAAAEPQPPAVVAEQARQAALLKKTDGNVQFKRGNYKEAVALYTQAIALDPSNAVLWQNRAAANLKLRRHAEVERDCNEAIARNAQAHKAFHRRGVARAAMHNYAEAISDFERVLQIEPKAQESRTELAKLKEELERRVFSSGSGSGSGSAPRGRVSRGNKTVKGGVTIEELPDDDAPTSPLIQVVGEASAPASAPAAHAPAPQRTTMKKRHVPQAPVLQHTLPATPPNSAYEFEAQWSQFHTDAVTLGEWLKRIEPSALPRLLGESADEEMLLSLFHAMRKRFFPHDGDRCYQMLQAMCSIPRFDLIMGMMESEDVVVLDRLFTQLMGYTSLRYGVDDVNTLSRRYGIKEDIMMRDPVQ